MLPAKEFVPGIIAKNKNETMRHRERRVKLASTIARSWIALLILSFLSLSVTSLGLRSSSTPTICGSTPSDRICTVSSPTILMAGKSSNSGRPETNDCAGGGGGGGGSDSIDGGSTRRRRILGAAIAVMTTGAFPVVSPPEVRARTTESNFNNYELGNPDCQTSCVRRCESSFPRQLPRKNRFLTSRNKNYEDTNDRRQDCLDACVRTGERYCHRTTSGPTSPSYSKDATRTTTTTTTMTMTMTTTSRYVDTTREPQLRSARPVPGLAYRGGRGGAWREGGGDDAAARTTSRSVDTTKEPELRSARPVPGLVYNGNRGGAWRD